MMVSGLECACKGDTHGWVRLHDCYYEHSLVVLSSPHEHVASYIAETELKVFYDAEQVIPGMPRTINDFAH